MRLKNSPLRRLPGKIFFCELEKLACHSGFRFIYNPNLALKLFARDIVNISGRGGWELNKNIYKPIVTDKANGRRVLVQKELR